MSDLSTDKVTNKVTNLNTFVGFAVLLCTIAFNVGGAMVILQQLSTSQSETKATIETSQKETKASIDGVSAQVAGLKETTLTQGFALGVIQKEQGNLAGQISANTADDGRQWENLRSVEALAKAALSREQFADWRREYERRNPGSVAPAVP